MPVTALPSSELAVFTQALEHGFAQRPSPVGAVKSTSASTTGSTQVAFGLATGIVRGDVVLM